MKTLYLNFFKIKVCLAFADVGGCGGGRGTPAGVRGRPWTPANAHGRPQTPVDARERPWTPVDARERPLSHGGHSTGGPRPGEHAHHPQKISNLGLADEFCCFWDNANSGT